MTFSFHSILLLFFLFSGLWLDAQESKEFNSFHPILIPAKGHSDGILKLKFSPRGSQLATASFDGTAKVWDVKSGKLILDIDSHKGELTSIDYSPDGKFLATASLDGTAKIWDVTTGNQVHDFNEDIGWVYSVNYSPDGNSIIICADSTTIIWDLKKRKEKVRFKDHQGGVYHTQYSPDGKNIISADASGIVNVWDFDSSILTHELNHKQQSIISIEYSPKGSYILTISKSPDFIHTINIWNSKTGKLVYRSDPYKGEFPYGHFSPDGEKIIMPMNDTISRIYNFLKHEIEFDIIGHEGKIINSYYSKDGKYLYTAGNRKFNIWNTDSKKHVKKVNANGWYFGDSFSFSPNNENIALVDNNIVILINAQSGQIIQKLKGRTKGISKFIHSPDRTKVVTLGFYNQCVLWNMKKGKIIWQAKLDDIYSEIPLFTSDSKSLLIRGENNSAKLINTNTGKTIKFYKGHSNKINSLLFSPNEKTVLTSSKDGTSKLWDRKSGEVIHTFRGHSKEVISGSFSPNGRKILTSSKDRTAILWDSESGTVTHTFTELNSATEPARISPNGKYVLTISLDSLIKIWDIELERTILEFKHNSRKLEYTDFGSKGKTIITSGSDIGTKIWSLETGKLIHNFKEVIGNTNYQSPNGENIILFDDELNEIMYDLKTGQKKFTISKEDNRRNHYVEFSDDGKSLIKVFSDYSIIIYDIQTGDPIYEIKPTSLAWDIDIDSEKKLLTLGLYNGSISIWSLETGNNIMSMFTLDGPNWVLLHHSGLFDASIQAMKWIYYLIGTEIIELDQLKERYYEPGLFEKVFAQNDALRDVESFSSVKMYPEIESSIRKNNLYIQLKERNGGIGKVNLFVNNKEVIPDANKLRDTTLTIDLTQFEKYYLRDTINAVSFRVYNERGWLKSSAISHSYDPESINQKGKQEDEGLILNLGHDPHLYAVVVGTSDYVGDNLDLQFADKDSKDMAFAIEQSAKLLFGAENVYLNWFTSTSMKGSSPATKKNIKRAIDTIANKANAEDVLLLYFSGHGVSYGSSFENEQFYYLTKDMYSGELTDPQIRESYAISTEEMTEWINSIAAQKQVMILDACSSGNVVEDLLAVRNVPTSQIRALDRMKDRTGIYVLAGSAADKVSYEASQFGQGLLTYSLLLGISGAALKDGQSVDVMNLFQYVRDQVPEFARYIGGVQTPTLAFPTEASSFDIGLMNDEIEIPLQQVKPLFTRSNFQEEESFRDLIRLSKALDKYLVDASSGPTSRGVIFIDVDEYENAFSVNGRYSLEGDVVILQGRLYKGKEKLGDFNISGDINQSEKLVEDILNKIVVIINQKEVKN